MNIVARAYGRLKDQVDELVRGYHRRMMPFWRWQAGPQRNRFVGNYIAIIGSCGKSTTTMLTARLFAEQQKIAVGEMYNMERDCLRLVRHLKAPVDHAIQETTEFPLGTLSNVSRVLRPDCAVVTSVGLDHLTAFRKRETVAAEFATLTRSCGLLVLNADDEYAVALAAGAPGKVVLFGTTTAAHVRAENITSTVPDRLSFDLVIGSERRRVATRFVGRLMLTNVLGALACAYAHGLDLDKAIALLATIEPAYGRMSVHAARNGTTIVLDTVKAPLWSTRLLVGDIINMSTGPRIFLLGALSDTGSGGTSTRYRQVLSAALEVCDFVVGFGEAQGSADRLTERHGPERIASAPNLEHAARLVRERPADVIIVKGNAVTKLGQDKPFLMAMQD